MSRLGLLVPARNAEAVIGRLLRSAAQGDGFDEVLVYDDASTDRTAEEARGHGATVVRSDVNTGPSAGKNRLASCATSEWIHFHDADDELAPGFVECARRWMQDPDWDALLFATEDRDDATGAHLGGAEWDDAALRADTVRFHIEHTVTNCGVYRRSAFLAAGGFEEDAATRYNEDQAMHLRLALAGVRFRAEPSVGVIIHRRASSMSADRPIECARAQVEVLARTAAATGVRYRDAIGARLWRLTGVCGSFQDWTYVDRCLALAAGLGYTDPSNEHWAVRALASFDAATAVRVREGLVRLLKPSLRAGVPVVSSTQVGPIS